MIDTARDLNRALADGHTRTTLIDRRAGLHPSGLLYGYVVESMLPRVTSELDAWHGIRAEQPPQASLASARRADLRVDARPPPR